MKTVTVEAEGHSVKFLERAKGSRIGDAWRKGSWYEHDVLQRIRETIQAGDIDPDGVVLDVGADCGNHTLWFAVVCGMRVAAFEPLRRNVTDLLANIELNDCSDRVDVYSVAAGAMFGWGAEGEPGNVAHDPEGAIQITPIDDIDEITDSPIALMKIDVEHMEPDVLIGARDTIAEHRPRIYMEALDDQELEIQKAILRTLGYTLGSSMRSRETRTPVFEWLP